MQLLSVDEYEAPARGRLPAEVWAFLAGGSGSESLIAGARRALDRIRLRPSVLVDVTRCDPATTVLGAALAAPLGVAPMAYHRLCHPEGEVASARAAGEQGALYVAAMFASRTLEEIAEATTGPYWLQLYWTAPMAILDASEQCFACSRIHRKAAIGARKSASRRAAWRVDKRLLQMAKSARESAR